MWNRRQVLSFAAAAPMARSQATPPPNIVIVMSDQQRAGLTRAGGFPLDTMPTLDRLATRGVDFGHAYTTAPLCVPARVSLLTGRWPHAHRVRQNSAANAAYFEKDLFQVCKQQGYRTAMCGKNHSHLTPERADFWRPYMHLNGYIGEGAPKSYAEFGDWMQRLNHGVASQPAPFPVEAQFPHRIVSDAIEFLRGVQSQPFALWVSFPEPHNPYQVPSPYFDMFPPDKLPDRAVGPEALAAKGFKWQWLRQLEDSTYPGYDRNWRRTRSNYLGMLRLIDDQVARLVSHLKSSGQMERTVLLYLSDHGDFFGDYGLERKGVELPEALVRIPMVWTGGGIQPQRNVPAFVSTADVMPTLCEAIGAPIPSGVQGRSLWPLLTGGDYPKAEFESIYSEVGFGGVDYTAADTIDPKWGRVAGRPGATPTYDELNPVTQSGSMKMVRMGDWKLTFDVLGNGQLYNLAKDPYELKNLFGGKESAGPQQQLMAELLRWTIRTQDDLPNAAYQAKRPAHNWHAPYRQK